jgi:uncharacterized protein (DUF433 family)
MDSEVRSSVASAFEGCYEAPRAAALSGVPVSTVYLWASKGLVTPSLSEVRPKRWSYADLMALRIVYWLRHPKNHDEDQYPSSPMPEVRRALDQLQSLNLNLWSDVPGVKRSPLHVDRAGKIVIVTELGRMTTSGHGQMDFLDILGPFEMDSLRGPDLVQPRPHLRIVPGKVAGEPHVEHSRLTTLTIAALAGRGYSSSAIADLYPYEDPQGISEAIELERTLAAHAEAAA